MGGGGSRDQGAVAVTRTAVSMVAEGEGGVGVLSRRGLEISSECGATMRHSLRLSKTHVNKE